MSPRTVLHAGEPAGARGARQFVRAGITAVAAIGALTFLGAGLGPGRSSPAALRTPFAVGTSVREVGGAASGSPGWPGPASSQPIVPITSPTTSDWATYGGNYANQRDSGLNQITTANVSQLKGAWRFRTGLFDKKTSFESSPIVVGNTMYVTGPHSEVFALNATTGAKEWEYVPSYARKIANLPLCCGEVNRGVAVGDGQVYVGQLNGELVALNATTGAVVWAASVGSAAKSYSETVAPLYADGMVFIGVSGAEYPIRGYLSAYDARTGRRIWRFYTIPAPGQVGHATWPEGSAWKTGGGSVWDTPAFDPSLGLLYFATGNPNPDFAGHARPGNNLFTDSIVAVHVDSGKLAWYYQEVHHDTWDYDATSPPLLFNATIGGVTVPSVAEAGKSGWLYILNRETGQPIHPIPEVAVPGNAWQYSSPTQPEPTGTAFVPHHCHFDGFPPSSAFTPLAPNTPTFACPGNAGGSEWSASSYNPSTGDVYVCAIDEPMIYVSHTPSSVTADRERWGSTLVPSVVGSYTGSVTAINVSSGTRVWQHDLPYPCIGGTLTTAGGLVFVGRSNGEFSALNAWSGRTLWNFQTGAGANAAPMTYEENGVQYVAVASGGSESQHTPRGDTLWVFSLQGAIGPAPAPVVKLPTVYTNALDLTAEGFSPAKIVVGQCSVVTFHDDTALPAELTVGSAAPVRVSPGGSSAAIFSTTGATKITATLPGSSEVADVVVASELPRGNAAGCT